MALTLTHLPQDVLILMCLYMPVEDVLTLIQTCRDMYHGLGSLDYLWRMLLSDWDIPLDIPLNTSVASLSSSSLRAAAVRSLKMDARWRHPRREMRHAQYLISPNSSFVDGMRLLPGGRWLVTLQYEQTMKTHVTLWSIDDLNDYHWIFRTTVPGRVRFLQAYHHHELEQITIGIVVKYRFVDSIRVYNVSLQGDSSACNSLVFEADSGELLPVGRIAGMKLNGEIMLVAFAAPTSLRENQYHFVCVNLSTRVTAVLVCPDPSFALGHVKLFRGHFVVAVLRDSPRRMLTRLFFYELPSVVLHHLDHLPPSVPRWPEKLVINSSMKASTSLCSDLDYSLISVLSDDIPSGDAEACSFTIFKHPFHADHMKNPNVYLLHVSFGGNIIKFAPTSVPCRPVPSVGDVRVSSSGRRGVWLSSNLNTDECTLVKFALEREIGNGSGSCISTLMPPLSGFPFNPCDFHSFVFDEISCKMAVSLPSGELYILHY